IAREQERGTAEPTADVEYPGAMRNPGAFGKPAGQIHLCRAWCLIAFPVAMMDVLAPEGTVVGRKMIVVIPNVCQELRRHRWCLRLLVSGPGKSNAAELASSPFRAGRWIPRRAHFLPVINTYPGAGALMRDAAEFLRRCWSMQ